MKWYSFRKITRILMLKVGQEEMTVKKKMTMVVKGSALDASNNDLNKRYSMMEWE